MKVPLLLLLCLLMTRMCFAQQSTDDWPAKIRTIIDTTQPLKHPRDKRLPLYVWDAHAPDDLKDAQIEPIIRALNERGIGLIASWNPAKREESLAAALRIARVQTQLGLEVNVSANACLHSFYDGTNATAHIDDNGKPFWDTSFRNVKMGCPFTLDHRKPVIREQVDYFVRGYRQAKVDLNFVFADWEIDGPIEFNRSHEFSQQCKRCREHIPGIHDFATFQKTLRAIRSQLQHDCYARPILGAYPKCLVGNYAIYPHDGLRYWYDYFEFFVDGQPHVKDQQARYRKWADDFPGTGYTFAMPVVYTWEPIFDWYDYADTDYRWFYNMLLVASNAGKHTPRDVPVISFVHWNTVPVAEPQKHIKQFSTSRYQELFHHMILRGVDGFFIWSPSEQAEQELKLVHPVYAEMQQYAEFLDKGVPITFDVPKQPGTVISGLELGKRLLLFRSDFGNNPRPADLKVGAKTITIPAKQGLQIIALP